MFYHWSFMWEFLLDLIVNGFIVDICGFGLYGENSTLLVSEEIFWGTGGCLGQWCGQGKTDTNNSCAYLLLAPPSVLGV